jgi:polysaccharide export outer membrane protein
MLAAMSRSLLRAGLAALALVAAGCPAKTPYYDYAKEPTLENLEYEIGVSDGLKITVWKNPDLSTDAVVRPDGTITMPLIGDIKAAGRTPSELRLEIQQRLGQFIKDESAVVTVAVTAFQSYRFTVSGAVEHPGVFTSVHYVTVAEAIALAGGPNKFANHAGVVIVRRDRKSGKYKRIPVNYDDVRSGRRPDMNLVLLPEDTVYVP